MLEKKINFDNNKFVTVYLLSEEQIRSEVAAMVELFKNNATIQMTSFISYLRIITRANHFISALNTNLVVTVSGFPGGYHTSGGWTYFYNDLTNEVNIDIACSNANPTPPSGFYPPANGKSIF